MSRESGSTASRSRRWPQWEHHLHQGSNTQLRVPLHHSSLGGWRLAHLDRRNQRFGAGRDRCLSVPDRERKPERHADADGDADTDADRDARADADATRYDDHRRSDRDDERDGAVVHVHVAEAGSTFECKLDTPAGAGTYARARRRRRTRRPRTGPTRSRSARPSGGQRRRDARDAVVHGRHGRARHDDHTGPSGTDERRVAVVRVHLDEAGATFECKLDGPAPRPGRTRAARRRAARSAGGRRVHASRSARLDAAGNVDAAPATRSFTVDTAAPDTTITVARRAPRTSPRRRRSRSPRRRAARRSSASWTRGRGPGTYASCTLAAGVHDDGAMASTRSRSAATEDGRPTRAGDAVVHGRHAARTRRSPTPSPRSLRVARPGNGADVPIADHATVESPITIAGCAGNASATATVEVDIVHTYIGDLIVTLIAPDGSGYVLHNRAGGSTDNIDQTYTVNLSPSRPTAPGSCASRTPHPATSAASTPGRSIISARCPEPHPQPVAVAEQPGAQPDGTNTDRRPRKARPRPRAPSPTPSPSPEPDPVPEPVAHTVAVPEPDPVPEHRRRSPFAVPEPRRRHRRRPRARRRHRARPRRQQDRTEPVHRQAGQRIAGPPELFAKGPLNTAVVSATINRVHTNAALVRRAGNGTTKQLWVSAPAPRPTRSTSS